MALTDDRTDSTGADRPARKGWLAAGGVVAAFLASACCIGPLVLLTLGISGAWIGNLTVLEPYKPWFAGVALVFVGLPPVTANASTTVAATAVAFAAFDPFGSADRTDAVGHSDLPPASRSI